MLLSQLNVDFNWPFSAWLLFYCANNKIVELGISLFPFILFIFYYTSRFTYKGSVDRSFIRPFVEEWLSYKLECDAIMYITFLISQALRFPGMMAISWVLNEGFFLLLLFWNTTPHLSHNWEPERGAWVGSLKRPEEKTYSYSYPIYIQQMKPLYVNAIHSSWQRLHFTENQVHHFGQ